MDIEYWRMEIDEIDNQLLQLLNMRARLAAKVGVLKRAGGLPLIDLEREHEVLLRVRRSNSGPLDERAVHKLFRRIIYESRRVASPTARNGHRQHEVLR
jgi:chorismate mutase